MIVEHVLLHVLRMIVEQYLMFIQTRTHQTRVIGVVTYTVYTYSGCLRLHSSRCGKSFQCGQQGGKLEQSKDKKVEINLIKAIKDTNNILRIYNRNKERASRVMKELWHGTGGVLESITVHMCDGRRYKVQQIIRDDEISYIS